jgi:hypothetical protein
MDRLFLRLSPATPCFERGWGALDKFDEVTLERLAEKPPAPIRPRWSRMRSRDGMWLRDGRFESPVSLLPAAARRGRVLWAAPAGRAPKAYGIALAAWNDETFDFRLRLMAPLIRAGLAVLMPENPLYGSRRLSGRRSGSPHTVEEFLQLGFGTVSEARGLLAGLRNDGVQTMGVSGFSMGGHMAALTAASVPWPVGVVAIAPSCTPSSVFIDGLLSSGTRFDLLDGAQPGSGRPKLRELLDRFSVMGLPPPPDVRRALIVGTRRDGIVPPCQPQRIAEHWKAELQWIDTGHVGAVTRHRAALREAIRTTFGL